MKTLTELEQTEFDTAEATILAQVRELDPTLDLRRGTVLRDVLIRPAAQLQALTDSRCQEQLGAATLADLLTATSPDTAAITALLSNFNLAYNTGTQAVGLVKLVVSAEDTYLFDTNTVFKTPEGALFHVLESIVVARTGGSVSLVASGSNFAAVFLVQAEANGTAGNLPQGTVLEPQTAIPNFVSASVYTSFTGGTDAESVAEAVSRIPAALSHRALTSTPSTLGLLRDRFGDLVQAVSLQGFGSATQQRDKVGLHGMSGGGCVDAYVRTFTSAPVQVLIKTGTRSGTGSYTIELLATDAPGFAAIRAITDDDGTTVPVESLDQSYVFTEARGKTSSTHQLLSSAQAAFSAYQTSTVTVTGVSDDADTHTFKVELYAAPAIATIQEYVDSAEVRNQGTDFLVRSPLMCLVNLKATVYKPATAAVTAAQLKIAVAAHINSLSFKGKLSLSELMHIMSGLGVSRIGMRPGELSLGGRIYTATRGWLTLVGDGLLDIGELNTAADLVVPDTVVFVADPADLDITVRQEA